MSAPRVRITVDIGEQEIAITRQPEYLSAADDPAQVAWDLVAKAVEDVRRALRIES